MYQMANLYDFSQNWDLNGSILEIPPDLNVIAFIILEEWLHIK